MEPNKFEKHIKEQMQKREIQPSASAWEKISHQLEPTIEVKNTKFLWYSVAASFIGILIVSILFFQSNGMTSENDIQIVDAEEETIEDKTNEISTDESDIEEESIVESDAIENSPTQETETFIRNETHKLKNQIASIEEVDTTIDSKVERLIGHDDFKEKIIKNKILEIVAFVDSLEQNTDALTEAEVDDLLRNAQNELLRDKLFDQQGSVDALALLTEVEDELDKSFRNQIFESLKTGFLKVRTAVADRNK